MVLSLDKETDLHTSPFFKFDFEDFTETYTHRGEAQLSFFQETEDSLLCPPTLNCFDMTCVQWISYSNLETSEASVMQQSFERVSFLNWHFEGNSSSFSHLSIKQ